MSLGERLRKVEERIANACAASGRKRNLVHLLAVSKLQPVSLIEEAYALGLRDFGENYVQELVEKRAALAHLKDIRWHLIGPLQTKKAKLAAQNANFFHALDSIKIADELDKRVKEIGGKPLQVFIQINVDAEATKSGIAPSDLAAFTSHIRSLTSLNLRGLMCIPEPRDDMHPSFKKMHELGPSLELSMGMSHDFETAIAEGANWIRVGTAIFGERKT